MPVPQSRFRQARHIQIGAKFTQQLVQNVGPHRSQQERSRLKFLYRFDCLCRHQQHEACANNVALNVRRHGTIAPLPGASIHQHQNRRAVACPGRQFVAGFDGSRLHSPTTELIERYRADSDSVRKPIPCALQAVVD